MNKKNIFFINSFKTNKGIPASVTSTLSSEIFLRWITKNYLTPVSAFSRVVLCFQLINFRKLGDARYYSQTTVLRRNHNDPAVKRIKRPTWNSRGSKFNSCIRKFFFCIYLFFAYLLKLFFTYKI